MGLWPYHLTKGLHGQHFLTPKHLPFYIFKSSLVSIMALSKPTAVISIPPRFRIHIIDNGWNSIKFDGVLFLSQYWNQYAVFSSEHCIRQLSEDSLAERGHLKPSPHPPQSKIYGGCGDSSRMVIISIRLLLSYYSLYSGIDLYIRSQQQMPCFTIKQVFRKNRLTVTHQHICCCELRQVMSSIIYKSRLECKQ